MQLPIAMQFQHLWDDSEVYMCKNADCCSPSLQFDLPGCQRKGSAQKGVSGTFWCLGGLC